MGEHKKTPSVDELAPEPTAAGPETLVAGAPAAYIPQMGTGLPASGLDEPGPGEAALEVERKAQRAAGNVQRG